MTIMVDMMEIQVVMEAGVAIAEVMVEGEMEAVAMVTEVVNEK